MERAITAGLGFVLAVKTKRRRAPVLKEGKLRAYLNVSGAYRTGPGVVVGPGLSFTILRGRNDAAAPLKPEERRPVGFSRAPFTDVQDAEPDIPPGCSRTDHGLPVILSRRGAWILNEWDGRGTERTTARIQSFFRLAFAGVAKRRYARGVTPNWVRKQRVKWLWSVKPPLDGDDGGQIHRQWSSRRTMTQLIS